jgi:hypothetical protein
MSFIEHYEINESKNDFLNNLDLAGDDLSGSALDSG